MKRIFRKTIFVFVNPLKHYWVKETNISVKKDWGKEIQFVLERKERDREREQITLTVGGRIIVQLVSSLTSLDMTNKQNMWVTNSFWEHGR